MDYLYEREINSNKGSLKTRRKQSAKIGEEKKRERTDNRRRYKRKKTREVREKKK